MKTTALVRRCGVLSLAAGAAWSIVSALSLLIDEPTRLLDTLMAVPLALTALAFLALHPLQRDRLGRLGQWGYRLSIGAFALLFASQAIIVAGIDRLYWLGFPVAAGIWFVGFLIYGIAIGISQLTAVLFGIALSPISPIADHGDYSGAIGHGIIWLAIGITLIRGRAFAGAPSSVRTASSAA
jgi:hypothetical protein